MVLWNLQLGGLKYNLLILSNLASCDFYFEMKKIYSEKLNDQLLLAVDVYISDLSESQFRDGIHILEERSSNKVSYYLAKKSSLCPLTGFKDFNWNGEAEEMNLDDLDDLWQLFV